MLGMRHHSTMKSFVVYGNCQSPALAKTLLENQEFAHEFEHRPLGPVQGLGSADVRSVLAAVQDVDLLILQPVGTGEALGRAQRPAELTSDSLMSLVPQKATVLQYPSLYFDAYFPHFRTLNGLTGALHLVHDYFVVYAFALGMSEKECVELVEKADLYPAQLSRDLLTASLAELQARESVSAIDLPISGFVANNLADAKLFNQFNHPTRPIFRFLAQECLDRIGVANPFVPEVGPEYLDRIKCPINPSTHNGLGLKFARDDSHYENAGISLTAEQVVASAYQCYAPLDKEELAQIVLDRRPFVAEIMAGRTLRSPKKRSRWFRRNR